jgi:1-acyl-sn-glycerol-3-phosphate acyltransferase
MTPSPGRGPHEDRFPPVPREAFDGLTLLERGHYRLAHRMNQGAWKGFWSVCQRSVGAWWTGVITRRITEVHGVDHLRRTPRDRPLLLVANHRSYFDMYVVASALFRVTGWRMRLFFPVRGRYYYQSVGGLLLNGVAGFWSMFPPLFATGRHQAIDRYSLELLIALCTEGPSHVIGIHPEGGRNTAPDPYSLRRLQPGVGRIVHAARPRVIPVFIAGLGNSVPGIIAQNVRRADPIRIWFGAELDLSPLLALPAKGSTYKRITEHVMDVVMQLGELDRDRYGGPWRVVQPRAS